jgi:23S rRNA (guanine745-N1)-methyltransferase
MFPAALAALLCPSCAAPFHARPPAPDTDAAPPGPLVRGQLTELPAASGQPLVCREGHSFDRARQGYINLLTGAGTTFVPDTATMVAARDEFLQAGHYRPLAEAVAARAAAGLWSKGVRPEGMRPQELVVDAGTGTGYYLRALLDRAPAATASIGLDLSKFALRRAARTNPDTLNLVWDLWRPLPLAAACADVVLVVFAPRNPAEFARILRPGGTLLVVTPLPGHLAEIAAGAGLLGIQADKQELLVASLAGSFLLTQEEDVNYVMRLDRADVARLALMGPAGHHMDADGLAARVQLLPEVSEVSASFRISAFTPVPAPPVAARRRPGQEPQTVSGRGNGRPPGPPAATGT